MNSIQVVIDDSLDNMIKEYMYKNKVTKKACVILAVKTFLDSIDSKGKKEKEKN